MGKIKKVLFTVKEGPFKGTSPYAVVKMALSVKKRGADCAVFYYSEGVLCLKKDLAKNHETFYEYAQKVEEMKKKGVRVLACRASLKLHGMKDEEIIEGVEITDSITDFILEEDVRVVHV